VPSRVEHEVLTVAGREVAISNPRKVLFPQAGYTKLDVARYYVAVAEGALRAAGDRPNVLVRYPNGIDGEFFYQKRAPESRPDWIEVVPLKFPSGRTAEEVVPRDAAALIWMVLGKADISLCGLAREQPHDLLFQLRNSLVLSQHQVVRLNRPGQYRVSTSEMPMPCFIANRLVSAGPPSMTTAVSL